MAGGWSRWTGNSLEGGAEGEAVNYLGIASTNASQLSASVVFQEEGGKGRGSQLSPVCVQSPIAGVVKLVLKSKSLPEATSMPGWIAEREERKHRRTVKQKKRRTKR
jgi:hypothetical protein